jgi:hypothetical protein
MDFSPLKAITSEYLRIFNSKDDFVLVSVKTNIHFYYIMVYPKYCFKDKFPR